MLWLRSLVREVYGLFVEDGSFAAALVVWMVAGCVGLWVLRAGEWGGPGLALGLIAALVENALRSARRRS